MCTYFHDPPLPALFHIPWQKIANFSKRRKERERVHIFTFKATGLAGSLSDICIQMCIPLKCSMETLCWQWLHIQMPMFLLYTVLCAGGCTTQFNAKGVLALFLWQGGSIAPSIHFLANTFELVH